MATLTDLKARHHGHFFDKQAMKFFNSRLCRRVIEHGSNLYFVTSEQFVGSDGYVAPRKFTARIMDLADKIRDLGKFQKYATQKEAYQAIKDYLRDCDSRREVRLDDEG